ncbi:hypothetical protein P355_5375 [Burkholderia cenocepacia KC-01]|nr:hypothetical protein P355_5375 [Burkholderia cenocepacia KC-01]
MRTLSGRPLPNGSDKHAGRRWPACGQGIGPRKPMSLRGAHGYLAR